MCITSIKLEHEKLENQLQYIICYVVYVVHKGMNHDYVF